MNLRDTVTLSHVPKILAAAAWQPRIVAFFCNWCTYTAADLAGVSRLKYAANIRVIRLMCSGRVDPQFILEALARGADGVLIGGCHPGDCHYVEGNFKMLRRFRMLKRMLKDLGIEEQRVRLEWISAAEGEKVKRVVNEMVGQVQKLGPLGIPRKFAEWNKEMEQFAGQVAEKDAAAACGCAGHDQPTTQADKRKAAHV
jgi:F420-non-reducing hydrogenase iron-sulfur subunit